MTNGSENKKTNSEIEAQGINSSSLPSAHLGSVRITNLGYSKDVKEEMIITTSSHDRTFIIKEHVFIILKFHIFIKIIFQIHFNSVSSYDNVRMYTTTHKLVSNEVMNEFF